VGNAVSPASRSESGALRQLVRVARVAATLPSCRHHGGRSGRGSLWRSPRQAAELREAGSGRTGPTAARVPRFGGGRGRPQETNRAEEGVENVETDQSPTSPDMERAENARGRAAAWRRQGVLRCERERGTGGREGDLGRGDPIRLDPSGPTH
jgi:hypothetical protein